MVSWSFPSHQGPAQPRWVQAHVNHGYCYTLFSPVPCTCHGPSPPGNHLVFSSSERLKEGQGRLSPARLVKAKIPEGIAWAKCLSVSVLTGAPGQR